MSDNKRREIADQMSDETWAVASQLHCDNLDVESLVPPIYINTTVINDSIEDYKSREFGYVRDNNPTRAAAECVIKALEGGAGTLLFSSGMAAISTVFIALVHSGDHIIVPKKIYSGTHMLLEKYWAPAFDVEITWIQAELGVQEYKKHIKANTKLLYAESPANPSMSVLDLAEFSRLTADHPGLVTVVDGTFATPYLQQPVPLGVDISMHSCSKYMGGHSDVLAGCLTFRSVEMCRQFHDLQTELGNGLSPWICSLLLRGLRTLPLRMERHSYNAEKLAEYLQNHPLVEKVNYPGLASHPDHAVAARQMAHFGGMISFEVKGGLTVAKALVENVRLIKLAVSLGGVETLIEHPATMTHGPRYMSDHARQEGGITPGLIRLSVGVENIKDLEKDLEQAFERVSVNTSQLETKKLTTQEVEEQKARKSTEKDINENLAR